MARFGAMIAVKLQASGIPKVALGGAIAVVNPLRIRHFAQPPRSWGLAEGYLAKTDLLDAAVLARDTP